MISYVSCLYQICYRILINSADPSYCCQFSAIREYGSSRRKRFAFEFRLHYHESKTSVIKLFKNPCAFLKGMFLLHCNSLVRVAWEIRYVGLLFLYICRLKTDRCLVISTDLAVIKRLDIWPFFSFTELRCLSLE